MGEESGEGDDKRRPTPPPVEFMKPGEAAGPLPPRDQSPAAWVPRPEDFRGPASWTPTPRTAPGASNLPRVAGILLLLSATIGMAGAVYNAVNLPSPADYANFTQSNTPVIVATLQICGLISIWAQGMALLGGIMAFQRMNWKLTLVCAMFSLATLGFFSLEASVIGLVALFMTIRARPFFLT